MELTRLSHPAIDFDLRYATSDNITGRPIYRQPVAFLRPEADAALMRACELAERQGLRLIVFDAYRPTAAQRQLWDAVPDPTFVADPGIGSNHTRGIAVDLTLADRHGTPLAMGTGFDDMTPRSYHGLVDISPEAQANRLTLVGLMSIAGFNHYISEWWHYDLPDPAAYPLLDGGEAERVLMG
jgi:D-alanyl-D-alanine dipeptidase